MHVESHLCLQNISKSRATCIDFVQGWRYWNIIKTQTAMLFAVGWRRRWTMLFGKLLQNVLSHGDTLSHTFFLTLFHANLTKTKWVTPTQQQEERRIRTHFYSAWTCVGRFLIHFSWPHSMRFSYPFSSKYGVEKALPTTHFVWEFGKTTFLTFILIQDEVLHYVLTLMFICIQLVFKNKRLRPKDAICLMRFFFFIVKK